MQRMEYLNRYKQPHEVIIVLRKITGHSSRYNYKYLRMHLNYYKTMQEQKRIIRYGKILNDDSVCVILKVSSNVDFENIILNDPAINKLFELVDAIPFNTTSLYE